MNIIQPWTKIDKRSEWEKNLRNKISAVCEKVKIKYDDKELRNGINVQIWSEADVWECHFLPTASDRDYLTSFLKKKTSIFKLIKYFTLILFYWHDPYLDLGFSQSCCLPVFFTSCYAHTMCQFMNCFSRYANGQWWRRRIQRKRWRKQEALKSLRRSSVTWQD